MKFKLYKILWEDITSCDAWRNEDYRLDNIRVISVGFLVEKTKTAVTLVSNIQDNKEGAFAFVAIPLGCILEMTELVNNKWIKRRIK